MPKYSKCVEQFLLASGVSVCVCECVTASVYLYNLLDCHQLIIHGQLEYLTAHSFPLQLFLVDIIWMLYTCTPGQQMPKVSGYKSAFVCAQRVLLPGVVPNWEGTHPGRGKEQHPEAGVCIRPKGDAGRVHRAGSWEETGKAVKQQRPALSSNFLSPITWQGFRVRLEILWFYAKFGDAFCLFSQFLCLKPGSWALWVTR